MRRDVLCIGAFFYKNWIMAKRNIFSLLELAFWPTVGLLSIGLMTRYLGLDANTRAFVLIGILATATLHVCQLDVSYSLLYSVWSKSVKHEFIAPVRAHHLVLGSWMMGMVRATIVVVAVAVLGRSAFDFDFLAPGLGRAVLFTFGVFCNAALVGMIVCALVLLLGQRAEIAAWSLDYLVMVLCGMYYPVELLPAPAKMLGSMLPITYFLEYFRSFYGFSSAFAHPLATGYGLALLYFLGGLVLLDAAIHRARRSGVLMKLSE